MEENKLNITNASIGLNTDSTANQLNPGQLTYALGAVNESFDGQYVTYSNEQSNDLCVTMPDGYSAVGVFNITAINRVIYFITDGTNSQIGYSDNGACTYTTIVSDEKVDLKLNFSLNYPIHKVHAKTVNCSTQIYWTDGFNPRRYLDFDDLPWVEEINPDNSFKPIKLVGQLDVNKMLVQPNFSIPLVKAVSTDVGGALKAGVYQFAVQYANFNGDGYTSFFNVTNPLSIAEPNKISTDYNYVTTKSINISVDDLDTTGLFDYINLAVIETVNLISTVYLVGTYPIINPHFEYTYTGENKSSVQLSTEDIFTKYPTYDTAQGSFEVDNVIGWYDLKSDDEVNYQPIWSKVKLNWETYKIPYNDFQGYSNGANTANYKTYMRDEVYSFEGCFILKNGKQTKSFHIPGRVAQSYDLDLIPSDNKDNIAIRTDECEAPQNRPRWEVYNTASVTGYAPEFSNDDNCYVGPYQYGEFSYWESNKKYPNNSLIWGDLADKPIRHHKFPDIEVSPIHDNNPYDLSTQGEQYKSFQHSIFPIGINIDINSLYSAIENSDLTTAQKSQIAGFKLLRGDRVDNKSVIAKGILHNVGKSTYDGKNYYYPNYPYNDLREDPFFSTRKLDSHVGFVPDAQLNGFTEPKDRFTFHSPDTHFYNPPLDNTGEYLKLESILYGKSYGHFIKVDDNAEYKFLIANTIYAAAGLAIAGGITVGAGTFGSPTFNMASVAPTYQAASELFEKLVPYTNFGYVYTSYGVYGNSAPVKDEFKHSSLTGFKQRAINYNKYLVDGVESIEDGNQINNYNREGSVYIHTSDSLLPTTSYDTSVPTDTSRFNLASKNISTEKPSELPYTKYQLNVTNVPGYPVIPIGSIYTDGVNEFEVIAAFITYDFNTKKYSGTIWVKPYNNSLPPKTSGQLVVSTSSPYQNDGDMTLAGIIYYDKILSQVLEVPEIPDSPDPRIVAGIEREADISSYYGAIKRFTPGQWGDIYSYNTIDTGFYSPLYNLDGSKITTLPTAFGGDIFINRFAYKSKLPFFRKNTVKAAYQSDVAYDETGNLNYPMFWLSTKPTKFTIQIQSEVEKLNDQVFHASAANIIGNLFTGGGLGSSKAMNLIQAIFKQIHDSIGIKNINFDYSSVNGIAEQGLMYLFSYGIPFFFCESEVNVDYRQAFNEREGNFFPNVGFGIPDDWLQEINVPIKYDNTYYYNQTLSKQNKENLFTHLREDWDPNKKCFTYFPNRAIWSDKSSQEETKNNWLIYRPGARYDLPKAYGSLVSIDSLQHNQMLVRFENKSQIYNALTTIPVNNSADLYVGNTKLFSAAVPLDLSHTDNGYAGSQHVLLLKTEFGYLFIDSKRGQIILLSPDNQIVDIADRGMDKWFSENLPFKIQLSFPDVNIDNHFNNLGLHGAYDSFYQRIILTKMDYTPKVDGIIYNSDTQQFTYNNQVIKLTDNAYFNNLSYTISYSFKSNSWVSFHSYIPNFYIPFPNYFQSGVNSSTCTVWSHNQNITFFNNYYGNQYPFTLEYPYVYTQNDEILQSVRDYCSAVKYESYDIFYEPDETIYFNEAIIYNRQQCTGLLTLTPKPKNSLSARFDYPKYNSSSTEILITKSDNIISFNSIWDASKSKSAPFFTPTGDRRITDKDLNSSNIDYGVKSFTKAPLRAKDARVRLSLTNRSDYKLITRFNITETSPSFK